MLVQDQAYIDKHAQAAIIHQQQEATERYLEDQLRPPGIADDQGLLRCNPEAQRGRAMSTEEFEKKLLSIAPHLTFASYGDATKRGCYWNFNTPHQQGLAFENSTAMPEFSIFEPIERELQDSSVARADFVLDARDLPKYEIVPEERDQDGNITREKDIIWDGLLPGMERKSYAWREKTRGWRQLLIMLVVAKQLSIEAMERVFGSANRLGYAYYLGKTKDSRDSS